MFRRTLAAFVFCIVGLSGAQPLAPVSSVVTLAAVGSVAGDCAALASLKLPDVAIRDAASVAAGAAAGVKTAHCQVRGVIGTEINFTLFLPDQWNGKFLMGGGGGFVGRVENQAVASLDAGYATAGTDTGHTGGSTDASWALDNLERRVNYGYLAVHRTAEVAKAIIRTHYGSPAARSYFMGCSNGGRQAMMSSQRFPDDFDGIVAAAPAYDFGGLAAQFIKNAQVSYPDPKNLKTPALTQDVLKSVEAQFVEKCDAIDGVKDGVFEDPRRCTVAVDALTGLTSPQRDALKKLYAETKSADGAVYFGQPIGSEGDGAAWPLWISGGTLLAPPQGPSLHYAFGTQFFKYFVFNDPNWDYSRYDISKARKDTRLAEATLSAKSTDLSAFKAKGRKLLMWHGWSDAGLTPLATVKYYEDVEARDSALRDYVRLFMLPGVLHCFGGPGPAPTFAAWWEALDEWVEKGKAPERIIATKAIGAMTRTRPLCPYPQRAMYSGSGSTDDAANFTCQR